MIKRSEEPIPSTEAEEDIAEVNLSIRMRAEMLVDPEECVDTYACQLILGDGSREWCGGRMKLYTVRMGHLLRMGADPADTMDYLDTDMANFRNILSPGGKDWAKCVYETFPKVQRGNLVILDRVTVYPPFRGRGMLLQCINKMRDVIEGAGLWVLYPKPLQYLKFGKSIGRPAEDKAADTAKLMAYYRKAGFKRIKGTDHMGLDAHARKPRRCWGDEHGEFEMRVTGSVKEYQLPEPQEDKDY